MPDGSQKIDIDGGVHCADFIGRDQNIRYGYSAEDVERLIERVLALTHAGAVFQPVPEQAESLFAEQDGQRLIFQPGAARQLSGLGSERAYLLALAVDQEYQRWASRFVPLAGKMDIRQVLEGLPIAFRELIIPTGEGGQATQKPLESIAEAMQTHLAFVILGEPGAGKTTTQQRIAYDAARTLLEKKPGRVPLFVRLSQQGERDPYAFLQTEWERRTEQRFDLALKAGRILILADGLNEIPREKRNDRLKGWMLFEQDYRGTNQLIFSGRERDYEDQLNLPRVIVQPLNNARIDDFLARHNATELRALLDAPPQRLREMASNPLHLFVLTLVYLQGGRNLQMLANSGKLFEAFADSLLRHEQRWHPDDLSVDCKVDLFARLAYRMQLQGSGTTFELAAARQALPASVDVLGEELPLVPAQLFRFGRGASILDPATLPDVRFYHHLLQEYFAARELLRRFNNGENLDDFWKTARSLNEMPPAGVGEWDPLPEPPAKGWEVTTILACGLSRTPEKLIEAVRLINPALAARCLDEAGIAKPEAVSVRTRADLLADLYNPQIHLRARLQAGYLLGKIGDPRFVPQKIGTVQVIRPALVDVPAGDYLLGSHPGEEGSYADESPQHKVSLSAFSIGTWPVTNAEYACFMAAGGYQNELFWEGDLSKRWLNGEEVAGGQMKAWLNIWRNLKATPNWKEEYERSGNYTPGQIKTREYIVSLSEDELKRVLSEQLSKKSRTEPNYWNDVLYNNASQPVVGITWFEARAYCAWLSLVSGRSYRLPSEVEWEAAAHGLPAPADKDGAVSPVRTYPWSSACESDQANTLEGRVLKPSPVGAYACVGSVGPFGTQDSAGNVWNWTSSLYLPYPYDLAKSELSEVEGERVLRGGSFDSRRRFARCAYRSWLDPVDFYGNGGFRVVSPGIFLAAVS